MARKSQEIEFSGDQVALISLRELAGRLGRSKRTIQRYLEEGKLLPPIRIKKAPQWRLDEVLRWMQAGCPSLNEWLQMKGK